MTSTIADSREDRVEALMDRLADAAPALEQLVDVAEGLASSGVLAGIGATLDEWDENFSAATRPEGMTLAANLMMLMGALSQIRYDAMFDVAMRLPDALNDGLEEAAKRDGPMGMLELLRLMRSPGMAGVLTMASTVLEEMHEGAPGRGTTPGQ